MSAAKADAATTGLEIAIVGAAGRFPGAGDLAALWRNLCDGIESISRFAPDELEEVDPDLRRDPRYVPARGVLAGADLFDAQFFGYSPREAEIIDPQQRIFLECAWEAIEDAGYDPLRYGRPVGIYAGAATSTYAWNLLSRPELLRQIGNTQLTLANDKDFLCTRTAYKLGLEGPSVVVQAACSTSLVAVHLASQALLAGECDMALAGGVAVAFPQRRGYLYQENGIFSPDGHCRTFDARAAGTVSGSGAGIVVLKRLADALRDGDAIRAVVKGSAINNDGAFRAGFTAPRQAGQAKVIRAAQLAAAVEPASIGYLEAHGTATPLGDPIEVAAATQAFRAGAGAGGNGYCAIGSIKTNLGHLDAAAGIAGLLKAVLALQHGMLPPSLHFERSNPQIDFAASPFRVNTRLADWPAGSAPRRAGVSSFGLGGANAHLVLEERPAESPAAAARPWQLIPISARTAPALEAATARLAAHLLAHPEQALADVAHTCQVGRRRFEHRRVVVCNGRESAAGDLAAGAAGRVLSAVRDQAAPPVAFLLAGLGDQYVDMGLGLYRTEAVFRTEVDRCALLLEPELGLDLRDVLYPRGADVAPAAAPGPAARAGGGGLDLRALVRPAAPDAAAQRLQQTAVVQPALFVLEYALAQLWRSFGIVPEAMLGYSLGEYVAACLAGVLALEEALVLVARRAAMIDRLPPGAMLAVPLAEGEIAPYLAGGLSLAAVNGRAVSVLAGPPERIASLEAELRRGGVTCRRLQTTHAFHSAMMEPIAGPLGELLGSFQLRPPRIPYLSNVTGTWIEPAQATDPAYWARHLVSPVRFAAGVATLAAAPRLLLEIGPGQSFGSLASQQLASAPGGERIVLPSLPGVHDPQADEELLAKTLGGLWLAGLEIDWAGVHGGERRRRVPLPTYPFERQRYWIARREAAPPPAPAAGEDRIADPAGWFHAPTFRLAPRPAARPAGSRRHLLLLDEGGLGLRLAAALAAAGQRVDLARQGDAYRRLGGGLHAVRPDSVADLDALLAGLGELPERIVHLCSLRHPLPGAAAEPPADAYGARRQRLGFFSLLALAQALARRPGAPAIELVVVTDGVLAAESGEAPLPAQATLLGPLRVIPQELAALSCRLIDVGSHPLDAAAVARLGAELGREAAEQLVALRGDRRWVPGFAAVPLAAAPELPAALRQGGVYLVTGGFKGIGLALAEFLARRLRARLVLVGRSAVPPDDTWQAIAAAGGEVLAASCDVTNREGMARVVARARRRFGRIDGVFHVAGVPGAGLIQVKEPDAAGRVLAPKVTGTQVLAEVLRDAPPDFLVLFSSLAAHVGGIGQADYCAANAFLDAFAQRRAARGGPAVVAIDWCEWQWDGWTDSALPLDAGIKQELARRRQLYGLSFAEGMEALCRILASGLPQVIVSTRDLTAALGQTHSMSEVLAILAGLQPQAAGELHARPLLGTPYTPPGSPLERRLVEIWQEILGIEQVGIHDNFLQLGGHSLLGLQLASRVRDALGLELPLGLLFAAPTVAGIGAVLGGGGPAPELPPPPPIARAEGAADVLRRVDGLSDEEVDGLLAAMAAESDGGGDL
jgi:acyl transferase domain-containing protein